MLVSLRAWASRHWLLALTLTVAAGLVVPGVLGGVSAFERIRRVDAHWLLLLLVLTLIAINLNVLRFRLLLRHHSVGLGQLRALVALLAVAFTSNATPGGAGAPVAALAILRRYRVPPWVGMAVLAVAALMDTVVLVVLLAFGLAWWIGDATGAGPFWQVVAPVLALVATLVVLWLIATQYRVFAVLAARLLTYAGVSSRWRFRLARHLVHFRRALRAVTSFGAGELCLLMGLCIGHRLLRYSIIFVAALALGGSISWIEGFLVQLLALGVARLLVLPGGLGGAEAAGIAMLTPMLGAGVAATAVLLWRFFTFHLYLIVGGPALLHLMGLAAFTSADKTPVPGRE